MDASHELRTPLTTLRTNIELLAARPNLDSDERQELLEAATFELQELSALVTELVDLAIERHPEEQDLDDVDLGELARRRRRRPSGVTGARSPSTTTRRVSSARTVTARARRLDLLDNAVEVQPA